MALGGLRRKGEHWPSRFVVQKPRQSTRMRRTGATTVPHATGLDGLRFLISTRSRPAPDELVACGFGLGLITLLMCAVHIRHGGFYYDDWSVLALGRFSPPGGLLHGLWLDYGQRPGQVLYYAVLDEAFGLHAPLRLALAAAMVMIEATCLYALLRHLGLAARHAVAIAALSLTFPFSDSVWLWGILSLTSLAIAASLLGVILALRALESSGRRALALHAASLSLYAASILSYEVFAVAGSLAGLLYVRAVGFRRARARWALDVVVICATLAVARTVLPIDIATPSRMQSPAGMAAHLGLIAHLGTRLAGAAALPIGGVSPWVGVGLLAAVLAAGAGLRERLPRSDAARAELGYWLAIAGAGALLAVAAWAVYVPAPDHYSPTTVGTVNRVNALAAIGIAVLVYSFLVLLARMLAQLVRLPTATAGLGATAAALAIGTAYIERTAADARTWDAAAADERRVLADLHAVLPRLPPAAVLYAVDAPRAVGPGIPVLNTTLDLTSAVRISYSSPGLVGVPVAGATSIACSARGALAGGVGGAYGEVLPGGCRRAACRPPERPRAVRRSRSRRTILRASRRSQGACG
jgi:hypothetical protein